MKISKLLESAYLENEGFDKELIKTIHPKDEMFLVTKDNPDYNQTSILAEYYKSGYQAILSLKHVLTCAGESLDRMNRILEFACGYGRVTRFLIREVDKTKIWSSDIMKGAVDFVKKTFGVNGFYSTSKPDVRLFDRKYDLIFVASLFSHLPEDRFKQWLLTLFHVLDQKGILIFSTHGTSVRKDIPKDSDKFNYMPSSENLTLDSKEYGSTFVPYGFVAKAAKDCGIDHLYHLKQDLWAFQDLYIITKEAIPGLEAIKNTSMVLGQIDQLQTGDDKAFLLSGWAGDLSESAQLERVSITLDGQEVATAVLGDDRPDVAEAYNRRQWRQAGWSLMGTLPELSKGYHTICVRGRTASGFEMCFDTRVIRLTKNKVELF